MKRTRISFITLFLSLFLSVFCFVSCGGGETKPVAITVTQTVTAETTLLEVMQAEQDAGKLTFEVQNGMVSSINGTANTTNSFWMLYTTDENNANAEWGTYEWNGETLGSAVAGAETLVVVQGETYVWVYQTF